MGLTGGIASGKSTLSRHLSGLGARVVDADELARKITEAGSPTLKDIRACFGSIVFTENGEPDRSAMARIVFKEPSARRRLEMIVHPLVQARAAAYIAEQDKISTEKKKIVVFDAALLVETRAYRQMDMVVVVTAPENDRIARLAARDGLSADEARLRIAAQADEKQKIAFADEIIENSHGFDQLEKQAFKVWKKILSIAAKRQKEHKIMKGGKNRRNPGDD